MWTPLAALSPRLAGTKSIKYILVEIKSSTTSAALQPTVSLQNGATRAVTAAVPILANSLVLRTAFTLETAVGVGSDLIARVGQRTTSEMLTTRYKTSYLRALGTRVHTAY